MALTTDTQKDDVTETVKFVRYIDKFLIVSMCLIGKLDSTRGAFLGSIC